MSYLSSDVGLPNFTKAVISLWFRVPQASVDAAKKSMGYDPETMIGGAVIPLLTFGGLTKGYNGTATTTSYNGAYVEHIGHGEFVEDYPSTTFSPTGSETVTTGFAGEVNLTPSMVAIDCSGDAPSVHVNLQTLTRAIRTGVYFDHSDGVTSTDVYDVTGGGTDPPPEFMRMKAWQEADGDITDFVLSGRPETFLGNSNVPVAADVWHHLLISFDISGSVGNGSSGCRMWMALDDANYTGEGLPSQTVLGSGSNTIFPASVMSISPDGPPIPVAPSQSGWVVAGQLESGTLIYRWVDLTITGQSIPVTYRFSSGLLKGSPLHVPAPGGAVRQVQMAELQIFTGVTLDTGVEANRRAFINSRGEPVDPLYGLEKARGIFGPETPNVTPSPPVQLLGKMPDISLTRMASNWGAGVNLGTSKVSLKPTGAIKPVRPDPVVGK